MNPSLCSIKEKARALFPGASNGEYGMPEELVPVLTQGKGALVWDTDGEEWLDMTMAWGAALIGHANPDVVKAVQSQSALGGNFAAINQPMVDLAERMQSICPCIEKIRFVASGTEATLLCLRVALGATGRRKILKFEGAYHGQHPVGVTSLVGRDLPDFPFPEISGTGIPWVSENVLIAPFNDLETTRAILEKHAEELGAVIVEPLHRCITPSPQFLPSLREWTRQYGIPLIFDEVVTGFRLALGGAQEYYGVVPDLAAYGKALGGGFSIGAYGGRADLMETLNEHRLPGPNYVWSASTGGGNPVSSAAALATLNRFQQPETYSWLHSTGRRWRKQMAEIVARHGENAQILGDGPLAQIAFSSTPVTDHRSWKKADSARGRRFMLSLLRRKVFLNPMGTKLYISLEHDSSAEARFLEAFEGALLESRSASS